MKVLLVEDDDSLLKGLDAGFKQHGFETASATTFDDAWLRIAMGSFTVIVMDVMLPGGTGIDLCKKARARNVTTPILLLTARDAIDDRVYGLESGADDYLTKPFAFEELIARVRALLRRPATTVSSTLRFEDLELDRETMSVSRSGDRIELTVKEFLLLELFMTKRGKILDRAAIMSYVWDENYDPNSNTVDVLVRRLREKLDDAYARKLISTVRGAGYRFGE